MWASFRAGECRLKEGAVKKKKRVERMSESRLTKAIYKTDLSGFAGRRWPRKTHTDLIGEVLVLFQC